MLIQAPVFLAHRIRRLLVPLRSQTKVLILVLYMASWYLFLSRLSSPSARRWSAFENAPPPEIFWISTALPCRELRYFFCNDVTGFRSPSPGLLNSILFRATSMSERVFVFLKKRQGKKVSQIISPLPQTRPTCPRWRVVEISTLIGLHVPLRHNSPGNIYPRFWWLY